jgi:hypothetical protein
MNIVGEWFVLGDGELVASFEPPHPDPEGAARREAARLNGGSDE